MVPWYYTVCGTMCGTMNEKKMKLTWIREHYCHCPFLNSVCYELLPIVEFHLDRISERMRGIFEYMHMKFKSTKEVTNSLSYFYSHGV